MCFTSVILKFLFIKYNSIFIYFINLNKKNLKEKDKNQLKKKKKKKQLKRNMKKIKD